MMTKRNKIGLRLCGAIAWIFWNTKTALAAGDQSPNMVVSSLKTFGVLLFILALILLAAWAAKRYLRFLPHVSGKDAEIRLVSTRALGPKRAVHLLEVEGRRFLIGSAEGSVNLIKEFESFRDPSLKSK